MAGGGVIGRDGALPWHLPADLKRFKALTLGKPMIMGRRTFASIGKPLAGRTNIVLTRQSHAPVADVSFVADLDAALALVPAAREVMIIGGAEIYRLALPRAGRIYLTEVATTVQGDTHFPLFDRNDWRETVCEELAADARHAHAMTFRILDRRGKSHD